MLDRGPIFTAPPYRTVTVEERERERERGRERGREGERKRGRERPLPHLALTFARTDCSAGFGPELPTLTIHFNIKKYVVFRMLDSW